MRRVGAITDLGLAKRFADFLLTRGIVARIDKESEGCGVWIHDEQYVEQSRAELRQFLVDPRSIDYQDVEREAEEIRKEAVRRQKQREANLVDVRSRWQTGFNGPFPVTKVFLMLMFVVSLGTFFGENEYAKLFFIEPFDRVGPSTIKWSGSWIEISRGQIWRLITPIFMHGHLIHLLFGLYMFFKFGRLVELRRGTWRFLLLVIVAAVVSNLCEYWIADFRMWPEGIVRPSPAFLGLSGVLYALFGYAWIRGRIDPSSGLTLHPQTVFVLMLWLIICFFGFMPIANIAHASGLLTGMAFGYAPAIVPKLRQWT